MILLSMHYVSGHCDYRNINEKNIHCPKYTQLNRTACPRPVFSLKAYMYMQAQFYILGSRFIVVMQKPPTSQLEQSWGQGYFIHFSLHYVTHNGQNGDFLLVECAGKIGIFYRQIRQTMWGFSTCRIMCQLGVRDMVNNPTPYMYKCIYYF